MEQQEWARLVLGALWSPPTTWLLGCCFSKEAGSSRSIWLVPLHRLSFQPHSDHARAQARGTGGWKGAWVTEHNALFLHKPVPNTPPKHPTLQAMSKKCQKPAASEFSHKECVSEGRPGRELKARTKIHSGCSLDESPDEDGGKTLKRVRPTAPPQKNTFQTFQADSARSSGKERKKRDFTPPKHRSSPTGKTTVLHSRPTRFCLRRTGEVRSPQRRRVRKPLCLG
ncbi:hypothetical protein AOLI_G00278730 [Acnodon oligacanthus]